jgi:conjugal transfer ATP-binding protein TraC
MMLFTINFFFPSQDALNRKLNFKRSMAFLHRFNILGDISIDKEIAREESRRLLTAMYGGEKIVKASYHLCVPSSHEESEFTSAQIVSYLNITTGSNAFKEDLIAPGIFVRCLPFGFDHNVPEEERFVRRAVTATSAVIAEIAPIYMSGKGVRTDIASGSYNRRGEGAWLDLFNKDTATTSPHCFITGATGAGKSVTVVDFIQQVLRQPSAVFILDKGDSYKRLCQLYGGQYLTFEGEPAFKLDPFAGDFDDDHRAFLTALISIMVTGGSEQISREEVSTISEAILSLLTSAEKTMNELADTLKSYNDPVSIAAARKLFPFYGMGQYARFTEGKKPRFEINNRLTVAELGDLDMYKDLQAVVVFVLIFYITEYVKKVPGRKYLVIEEASFLFKNETAVDFLVKAAKTFRKYGCALIFVTQQLDDFMVIARAMNMKDNCPNKILLYQEMDVVSRAAKDLALNEGTLDLYKTIKKSNKFAEALVVAQNWTSVFRITLDPVSYWIATTSEPDKVYFNELLEQGMTLHEAIKHAAREHPFGVHTGTTALRN